MAIFFLNMKACKQYEVAEWSAAKSRLPNSHHFNKAITSLLD